MIIDGKAVAARVRGEVAREVSATLPVSGAMLSRLSRGGRVTIDVALALAGWLGRTVESLTRPSKT